MNKQRQKVKEEKKNGKKEVGSTDDLFLILGELLTIFPFPEDSIMRKMYLKKKKKNKCCAMGVGQVSTNVTRTYSSMNSLGSNPAAVMSCGTYLGARGTSILKSS